jgi:hypothetical protein
VPILLSPILSGISIYWASPIYQHKPDPITGTFDLAADIGIWICDHVPGLHRYSSPPDWVYNHMSLGPGMLAVALRLHWLCAYAFMLNGAVYVAGLIAGGGRRGLQPRRTDLLDALRGFRYYIGFPLAKVARRQWLKRSALDCGARSATPPDNACKTRLEECEGYHQTDLCRARAARLLGRTRLFSLWRNLTHAPQSSELLPSLHPPDQGNSRTRPGNFSSAIF